MVNTVGGVVGLRRQVKVMSWMLLSLKLVRDDMATMKEEPMCLLLPEAESKMRRAR